MGKKPEVIVVPRERAVFRLDANGCWRNEFGRFEKKSIIDYFHQAIQQDDDGYFVQQDKGGVLEKVYFPYEDTALFVFQVRLGDPVLLILNTGAEIKLSPDSLWIEKDYLYLQQDGHRIRFTDRAMMKIAPLLIDQDDQCYIKVGGRMYRVPEME